MLPLDVTGDAPDLGPQFSVPADAIPSGIACIDRAGICTAANQQLIEWMAGNPVGVELKEILGGTLHDESGPYVDRALAGERQSCEGRALFAGGERYVHLTFTPDRGAGGAVERVVVVITDITERRSREDDLAAQASMSQTLVKVGRALSRELDLHQLVQTITDAATELAGASFGAFFYNVLRDDGESYTLYTISGVPREAFSKFPMPRNTKIFDPTFRGLGIVRYDDVTAQPEYGQNPPYRGMPGGHLPVRSYLAAPVISSGGEVLGGLFFGHEKPGMFTARTEAALAALAAQAGVAIENSRLVAALRRERTQAEEAGRHYQFLAEIIPPLLWTSTPNGDVDYVNLRWIEFTGADLAHSAGTAWQNLVHPDDLPRAVQAWQDAVGSGDPYEMTLRIRRVDGAYRWFLNRAFPLRDPSGAIVKWFGSCTDIDDQKRHENNERLLSEAGRALASSLDLETSLSTVAALVAAWFQGYCLIDLLQDGSLRRVAAAHVDPVGQQVIDELRNYAPGQDHSNPIWRVLDSRATLVCNQLTEPMLHDAAQSSRHVELRRQLGTTGYVLAPLIARGSAIGAIMLASTAGDGFAPDDVRTVEELAYRTALAVTNSRAYEQAREANRLKDEFLAVVSHELRTPLNAMRGWTTLLKSRRLSPAQEAQAIEVIDRNINAQAQLVDDLLDISRIVSGKMRLAIAETDLARIVHASIESVAPAASAKGIAIHAALDERLAPIAGDADRLQQVVWNLLSNAIKFTNRGGDVRVSLHGADGFVELAVADSGQGISAEFLPHVFDRFRQGDSTTTRPVGGLGLGLAIVRHLVELHGGTVSAYSDGDGKGATFRVHLPLPAGRKTEGPGR